MKKPKRFTRRWFQRAAEMLDREEKGYIWSCPYLDFAILEETEDCFTNGETRATINAYLSVISENERVFWDHLEEIVGSSDGSGRAWINDIFTVEKFELSKSLRVHALLLAGEILHGKKLPIP